MRHQFRPRLRTERMEDRTAPAVVALAGDVLTITGTGPQLIEVSADQAAAGARVEVRVNRAVVTAPGGSPEVAAVRAIRIAADGFANTVQVAVAGTRPAPLVVEVTGGAKNDIVSVGGDVIASLSGGDGDDFLTADVRASTLLGGAGNDNLRGGVGTDVLLGGAGNDTLSSLRTVAGNDLIDGEDGFDKLLVFGARPFDVLGVADLFTLAAAPAGRARLQLASSDGSAADLSVGTTEQFELRLGTGDDTVVIGDLTGTGVSQVAVFGDDGVDTVDAEAQLSGVGLTRNSVEVFIPPAPPAPAAAFAAGKLTVTGTGRADDIRVVVDQGSAGGPVAVFVGGLAVPVAGGPAVGAQVTAVDVAAGLGNDNVRVEVTGFRAVPLAVGVSGGRGDDALAVTGAVAGQLSGGDGNDALTAGGGADVLDGGAGNDTLTGGGGADALAGGDGDDLVALSPSPGADVIDGGAGLDTVRVVGTDLFRGGPANDRNELSAAGARLKVVTPQGPDGFTALDIGTTEVAEFRPGNGDDFTLVGDLTGVADLREVRVVGGDGTDTVDAQAQLNPAVAITRVSVEVFVPPPAPSAGVTAVVSPAGTTLVVTGTPGADDIRVTFDAATGGGLQVTANGSPVPVTGPVPPDLGNARGSVRVDAGAGNDTVVVTVTGARNPRPGVRINGGAGDDTLTVVGLANGGLDGGDGNDVLTGGAGNDALTGGAGDDVLSGNGGGDRLFGGNGNDVIDGADGDDLIDAGAGNDVVTGGLGSDAIAGGAGDDFILGDVTALDALNNRTDVTGNDTIDAGDGNDRVDAGFGNDAVAGGLGDDVITGGFGADVLDGGAGDDTVYGEFEGTSATATTTALDAQTDVIDGGDGNDVLFGDISEPAGLPIFVFGRGAADTIRGGAGNDLIDGNGGADRLEGGDGDDVFANARKRGGDDTVAGGAGFDYLRVFGQDLDSRGPGVVAPAVNTFRVSADPATGGVRVTGVRDVTGRAFESNASTAAPFAIAAVGLEGVELNTAELIDRGVRAGDTTVTADDLTAAAGLQWVYAVTGGGNDVIDASAQLAPAVTLYAEAGAGNDTVTGGAGFDDLDGGDGNDTITGGAGGDFIKAGAGDDTVFAGAGDDFVRGGAGDDLLNGGDGSDILFGGDGNDRLNGDAGDDLVSGEAGADRLNGGFGWDEQVGGPGADVFFAPPPNDDPRDFDADFDPLEGDVIFVG